MHRTLQQTNDNEKPALEIGRRVHCILYGGKDGTVVAIRGTPAPATVRDLGGIGVAGGRATADIVWDNGTTSRQIPEAIIYSVQWRLLPEVVGSQAVAAAVRLAEETAVRLAQEKAEKERLFEEEKARLIADRPELVAADPKVCAARWELAIKNIRRELKAAYPGVKFSVRKDRSLDACITWTDGPTEKEVGDLLSPYKAGHFDGMEDIYRPERTPFTAAFGSVDYIHTSRVAP